MPIFSAGSASVQIVPDFSGAQKAIGDFFRRQSDIHVTVKPDLDNLSVARTEAELNAMHGTAKVTVDKNALSSSIAQGINDAIGLSGLNKLGGLLTGLIKPAAITALTGTLTELGAAASQSVGLLALVPAGLAAIAVPAATVAIGIHGISAAFKAIDTGNAQKIQQAMQGLAPAARDFVVQVHALSPAWTALRLDVQQQLLAGVGTGVTNLARVALPILRTGLTQTAGALNTGLLAAMHTLQGEGPQFSTLFSNIAQTIRVASGAASPLIQAFLTLGSVGSRFLPQLAAGFVDVANKFNAWIQAASRSGELVTIIQNAINVIKQLGQLALNVGSVIVGLFQAALPYGNLLLGLLVKVTGQLAAFVHTPVAQSALATFFRDIEQSVGLLLPPIARLAQVIVVSVLPAFGQLVKILAPIAATLLNQLAGALQQVFRVMPPILDVVGKLVAAFAPLIPVIAQVALTLLPPLARIGAQLAPVIAALAEAIGKALVGAARALAPLLEPLGAAFIVILKAVVPLIGPLTSLAIQLLPPLVNVARALAPLLTALVQVLTPMLTTVIRLVAATVLPFLVGLLDAFAAGLRVLTGWIKPLAPIIQGVVIALGVWKVAQILLNIAMSLNPIGLVIIAIGLLVAAIGFIVTHLDTFKAIWNTVWTFIKNTAIAIWTSIANFFTDRWNAFSRSWQALWNGVSGFLATIWNHMVSWLHSTWTALASFFADRWSAFSRSWTSFWNGVSGFLATIWGHMVSWLHSTWTALASFFSSGWSTFRRGWDNFWNGVSGFLATIWDHMVSWVRGTWSGLASWFGGVFRSFESTWDSFWGRVSSAFGRVWAGIRDYAGKVWGEIRGIISAPVKFVVNTVLIGGLFKAWNAVNDFLHLPFHITMAPITGFATGGVLPGYAPGRDSVLAALSPGEGILVPEAVRGLGGERAVHAINSTFSNRVPGPAIGSSGMPAFAGGGISMTWPQLWSTVHGHAPNSVLTSGYRPGASDYHGLGDAIDVSFPGNPQSLLEPLAAWIAHSFPGSTELIHNPNASIKDGRPVSPSFWGAATWAEHANHVHWAMTPAAWLSRSSAGVGGALASILGHAISSAGDVLNVLTSSVSGGLKTLGTLGGGTFTKILAAMPGKLIGGMWDKIKGQAASFISSLVSSVTTGSVDTVPSSRAANVAAVQRAAAPYGWASGTEWSDLVAVIMRESGFNNNAQNPHSTAYGIFQFLDSTWGAYTYGKTSDPFKQAVDGMEYIRGRYGDPAGALRHEQQFGWYDRGGALPPGYSTVLNGTGDFEWVLNKAQQQVIGKAVNNNQAGGDTYVRVYLSDRELIELVDKRVTYQSQRDARHLRSGM